MYARAWVCVCIRINFVKAFKGIVSSVPYSRAALSSIDAHFSIFTIKRACHRGFDAKERNYMDHFDGKKKRKRKKGEEKRSRDGMTGKRNGCPLVDGNFPWRARWLNKLYRSSLAILFLFSLLFNYVQMNIPIKRLSIRKFPLGKYSLLVFVLPYFRE